MARTTSHEVKEIIETTLTNEQVNAFILGAHAFLEDALAGEDYPSDLRREIERWYTACMIASRDPRTKSKKVGDGAVTYDLTGTTYWEQVKRLDHHGILAEIEGSKGTAEVRTLDVPSHASE